MDFIKAEEHSSLSSLTSEQQKSVYFTMSMGKKNLRVNPNSIIFTNKFHAIYNYRYLKNLMVIQRHTAGQN